MGCYKNLLQKTFEGKIFNLIHEKIMIFLFKVLHCLKINDRKIVFSSFRGMGFCDSPKYIYLEMDRRNLDFEYVWIAKNVYINQFPKNITVVPYNSLRAIKELATAHIWIDNCRKEVYVRKRRGQLYINTWHNGMSLKRVERAAETSLSKGYLKRAKNDSKMVDVFLSNSQFSTNRYKKYFWYNGTILETGLPRNDILFKDTTIVKNNVKKYFNIAQSKKILLYAPTFRKNFNMDKYVYDFDIIIDSISKKFGGEWIVLFHLHPNVAEEVLPISKYSEKIINATFYPDFQELIVASDILITDYSSVMFEFSIIQKPVFLLMTDIDEYIKDRNFAMPLESLPYSKNTTIEEMIDNITRFNTKDYYRKIKKFFCTNIFFEEGHASENIVNFIERMVDIQ